MAGAAQSDLPDMTLGEEIAQILKGFDLRRSLTETAIVSGHARLLMRESAALDALDEAV